MANPLSSIIIPIINIVGFPVLGNTVLASVVSLLPEILPLDTVPFSIPSPLPVSLLVPVPFPFSFPVPLPLPFPVPLPFPFPVPFPVTLQIN